MRDGNDPVDIIAYDQRLGIAPFPSTGFWIPFRRKNFTEEIAVGDRLTELRLSQEDSGARVAEFWPSTKRIAIRLTFRGGQFVVGRRVRLDGKMRRESRVGALETGKGCRDFLGQRPLPRHRQGQVVSVQHCRPSARRAFADLVAAHAAAAKTPGSAEQVFIVFTRT